MGKRHKIGGDGVYLPEELQEGHVTRYLRQAHNAGPDVRRIEARNRFLQAAAELDSALLESLKTDVLPLYNHRWTNEEKLSELRHLHHGYAAVSQVKDRLSPFGAALVSWLERWHLTETWAMNAALWTVENWEPLHLLGGRRSPASPLKWRLENPKRFYPPVVGTFQPNTLEWPLNETSDAFVKRARASFEGQLRLWVKERSAEYRPTPTKENLDHFQWCALRQVYGFSYEHIAVAVLPTDEHHDAERKTIEKGAKATFKKLLGMTPRRLHKPKGYSGTDYRREQLKKLGNLLSPRS